MSKIATRPKNAREAYVEQLASGRGITTSMNRKRDMFTGINPLDGVDLAYRSTPNYLRQLAQQGSISPNEILTAANVPRTKSASELTPRNNLNRSISGNPRYKAQEDYYDEIQIMKKDMKTIKDENSNLRAKIRRLEEDNTRKRKEIDTLYDSNKDGDLRRTLAGSTTDRNNSNNNTNNASNVVMSLKQRLFKLESQLKQKETIIDELKSDPRWTKGTELELQNRALLGEIERQKVEKLNYIQKNDYPASLDEEKKTVIRKLTKDKDELKEENESLKRKIREMEKSGVNNGGLSARSMTEKSFIEKNEDHKEMKHELDNANRDLKRTQIELEQAQEKLEQANVKLAKMKHEKSQQDNADLDEMKQDRDALREKSNRISKELNEVKHDRDQYKKRLDQIDIELEETKNERDRYKKQLDAANERIERLQKENIKTTSSGRSSPVSTPFKRTQSPVIESESMMPTKISARRDPSLFDESLEPKPKMTTSKPFGSRLNNSKNDNNENRPSSPNIAQESALKTVQASLRGHIVRNELNKTQEPIDSKSVLPRSRNVSPDKSRSPSPPASIWKSNQSHTPNLPGSKSSLSKDTDKMTSKSRFPIHDEEPISKPRQSLSSLPDQERSSSNSIDKIGGSKSPIPTPKNKITPANRVAMRDPDYSSNAARPSSPTTKRPSTPTTSSNALPHSVSPDNPRPPPRKIQTNAKQSLKPPVSVDDDDDDIVAS